MKLPTATQRLFSEVGGTPVASPDVAPETAAPETAGTFREEWVIERLLEDGDRADLRWLFGQVGRDAVVGWFESRSERRLSDRSRVFWALVLGCPAPTHNSRGADLWPL